VDRDKFLSIFRTHVEQAYENNLVLAGAWKWNTCYYSCPFIDISSYMKTQMGWIDKHGIFIGNFQKAFHFWVHNCTENLAGIMNAIIAEVYDLG